MGTSPAEPDGSGDAGSDPAPHATPTVVVVGDPGGADDYAEWLERDCTVTLTDRVDLIPATVGADIDAAVVVFGDDHPGADGLQRLVELGYDGPLAVVAAATADTPAVVDDHVPRPVTPDELRAAVAGLTGADLDVDADSDRNSPEPDTTTGPETPGTGPDDGTDGSAIDDHIEDVMSTTDDILSDY